MKGISLVEGNPTRLRPVGILRLHTVRKRQGLKIACLEQIAVYKGCLTAERAGECE